MHHLYVHTKNANDVWGLTNEANFYIVQGSALFPSNENPINISSAEYFINTDPGCGNGTNIPVTTGADIAINNIAVSIGSLAVGVHRIYVRAQNINGWSQTNSVTFMIGSVATPVTWHSFTGKMQTGHSALLLWKTATERSSNHAL